MNHEWLADFFTAPEEVKAVLDLVPVGITLTDNQGRILFYNQAATRLVDRKPEMLGTNVRDCHQTQAARSKIDQLFTEFSQGRREPLVYRGSRRGRTLEVSAIPVFRDGRFLLVMHTLVPVGGEGA